MLLSCVSSHKSAVSSAISTNSKSKIRFVKFGDSKAAGLNRPGEWRESDVGPVMAGRDDSTVSLGVVLVVIVCVYL